MQIGKAARSNGSHIKSRLKMEPHGVFKEVTKQCTNKDHYQSGRGARERGGRRLEVEVNAKRRSPSHYVSDLVLETVEESCAFGEDIVLVGLR